MRVELPLAISAVSLLALAASGCEPANPESTSLVVQTAANPGNAMAGDAGANIAASAMLSVVVIRASDGQPVSHLGSSVGDGTSQIGLPSRWILQQGFSVPPGGCLMSPTQFGNHGDGIYTIRVVPFLGNPDCTWLSGDYHYVVQLSDSVDTQVFSGSGLGVLKIP